MDLFHSNITDVRVVHIVRFFTLFSAVYIFTSFSVIDLLRGPDDILVFADFEHGSHHKKIFVEIFTSVRCIDQMRLFVEKTLLENMLPTQWNMMLEESRSILCIIQLLLLIEKLFIIFLI